MENKRNSIINNRHKCIVIPNILCPTKHAKTKNSHYSPILQECMNNCSGISKFRNFRIILDRGGSQTTNMGKLMSKLKQKETTITTW